MFVVSGAWLDDRHGVSTAGLGLVATGFGAVELVASMSAAAFSDRIGLRRSVLIGLGVLALGLAIAAASGPSRLLAIAGLIVFLIGFEFAFVTSLSLVTEAAPLARGRAIGVGNALGTIARSAAVLASGLLYDSVGIGGSFVLSAAAATIAAVLIVSGMTDVVTPARRSPRRPLSAMRVRTEVAGLRDFDHVAVGELAAEVLGARPVVGGAAFAVDRDDRHGDRVARSTARARADRRARRPSPDPPTVAPRGSTAGASPIARR